MTQPLALVLCQRLLPANQLVNRLQDLKYRVHSISDPKDLPRSAEEHKPMLVIADTEPGKAEVYESFRLLRRNPVTNHLPIIAFAPEASEDIQAAGMDAGATLFVSETAILTHLPQIIGQALQLD